mgnify:CR=1 FL=1
MSVVEVEKLLAPVSDDAPGGAEVEYDPEYFALEKLAQGTPESVMGNEVKPAEEPNWSEVKSAALALFDRTRDLRVAMILTVALLKVDGVPGFADGSAILKGFVENMWEQFYPKLDPDDNNDPTIRVNILKNLAGNTLGGDMYKFIPRLREATLTNSKKRIGKFSFRDIQIARGDVPAPKAAAGSTAPPPPEMTIINAAFEDTATEDLLAVQTALEESRANVKGLDAGLGEKVGPGVGPDVTELADLLKQMKAVIDEQLSRRGIGQEDPVADSGAGEATDGAGDGAGDGGAAPAGRPMGVSGEVSSRQDVIRVLDKICTYYERYEPGSPVPIFLKRAKRLVTMNFMDLIKDLAPDANDKISVFIGPTDQPE